MILKVRIYLYYVVIILIVLPNISICQNKYQYEYKIQLISQLSTFDTLFFDTLIKNNNTIIQFIVLNKNNEPIPFANIKINANNIDTVGSSDLNGFFSFISKCNLVEYSVTYTGYFPLTKIKINSKPNSKTVVKILLGSSDFVNKNGVIKSSRKLSEKEITQIINDCSNENYNNELIKNNTCQVYIDF